MTSKELEEVEVPHPPPTLEDPDLDATDDEVDYVEGIERGFAALRVGAFKSRNFDGVMEALDQMEDKEECASRKEKMIEHVWMTKGKATA